MSRYLENKIFQFIIHIIENEMKNIIKRFFLIFLFINCISGCAAVKTQQNTITEKKIFLAFINNKTLKPRINEILTEKLSETLLSSNAFKLVNKSEADYLIYAEVSGYISSPIVYAEKDFVELYSLQMAVDVVIKNKNGENKFLEFTLNDRHIYSETSSVPETEKTAAEILCGHISFSLYDRLIKKFL